MPEKKSSKRLSKDAPVARRNDKGGILIREDELKIAWDFFDTKGQGKLTAADIKRRLSTFYHNVSNKEIKFLLNNQPEISFDELYELLKDNQLTNFDPVKEAFKVYDPQDTGFVDMSVVKEFFHNLPMETNDNFHIAVVTPVIHYCMGGLKMNPDAEILTAKDEVIPGLYAAGEAMGGVHGNNRLGGNSLLDCVVFGRVSGRSAARHLTSENIKYIENMKTGASATSKL